MGSRLHGNLRAVIPTGAFAEISALCGGTEFCSPTLPKNFDLDFQLPAMNETFKVQVLSKDGSIQQVSISPSAGGAWSLLVDGLGMQGQVFEGADLFDALIVLRKQLERNGFRLLCAGARRDVLPSGMARSMGGARQVYVLELGKPATTLIDIFSAATSEEVGTVDEQQSFGRQWMTSLREKMK
ncbi:hypothetical protein [Ponticaulis sp.]|uniref:hypothetical protein n=1 Tax=Ponticaulis sp. TaxID=2020902 RepID=UPI002614B27A|nr:hypothetical protein [Ponticaulis sp.]MDF1680657.1 hypothetical protein [Ponticaulis sp.]